MSTWCLQGNTNRLDPTHVLDKIPQFMLFLNLGTQLEVSPKHANEMSLNVASKNLSSLHTKPPTFLIF